jgi:DNA repair protein SbcD/Mre11
VKIILFSDLHLDAPFLWAPPALGRKLRGAVYETLGKICALAKEQEVDAVLCGGNLYEQDYVTAETAEALHGAFADLAPTRVFLAPGNRDWYGPDSLYRRVKWSPNVHVFDQPRLTAAELGDGSALFGAAHCGPAVAENFLRNFRAKRGGWNFALFHAFDGFRESDIRSANLHHAFVGDADPKDSQTITYPGSPQPLDFGKDAGGAIIAQFGEGAIQRRMYDVSAIRLHDLNLDVSGLPSVQEIRDQAVAKISGLQGIARITVRGVLANNIDLKLDDLKAITCGLDGLIVRAKDLTLDYDLDAIANEATVRGQFVKDVRESVHSDEEKQRILTVGLRALDGRRDLEPF